MNTDSWLGALRRAMRSGAAASVVSTLILMRCGNRERGDAARPINGPSQWVWGRHAPHVPGPSVKHTLVGYAIHHAMSVLWATLFERLRTHRTPAGETAIAAAATAAIAYVADFKIVPPRLSPGFETELSRSCVVATYIGFAIALACVALAGRRERGSA